MGLVNIQITNFDNGVNNRNAATMFGSMAQLDPTRFHTYMEDFDSYLAADWNVTEVGSATQALTDADGGVLLITNAAADDNRSFSQKVGESFLFEASKPLYFRSQFEVNDALQSDVLMGLQITDTTPLDASDGVYFIKADGSTSIFLVAVKGGVTVTATEAITVADATGISLEFYWDGIDRIYYGFNGNVIGHITPGVSLPDDEVLTVSFGIQNGEAVAKTMAVDYVFVAKERG